MNKNTNEILNHSNINDEILTNNNTENNVLVGRNSELELSINNLNNQSLSNFQAALNEIPESAIEYKKEVHNKLFSDETFTDFQLQKFKLPFDFNLNSLVNCDYGNYNFNYEQLDNFIISIRSQLKKQIIESYKELLVSDANGFLAIINANNDKNKAIIDDLNVEIIRNKITIGYNLEKLEVSEKNIEDLKAQLVDLNNQINDYENKFKVKFNWNEVFKNKRKSISSTEDFLLLNLKSLEEKYLNLELASNSKEELIIIQNNKLSDYINLANSLQNNLNILNKDLENNENLLMESHSEIASLEANKIRLNNEITLLKIELNRYKSIEESNIKVFAQWEENEKTTEAKRKEEREIHYETIWENGQLKNQIYRSLKGNNLERNQLFDQIDNLNKELTQLADDYHNNKISLTVYEETIKQLERANSISKLKLIAVLSVDFTRFFMPNWYGFLVSSFETTILVGELTGEKKIKASGWLSLIIISLLASYVFIRVLIVKILQLLIIIWNKLIEDKSEIISLWNIWNVKSKSNKDEKVIVDINNLENNKLN